MLKPPSLRKIIRFLFPHLVQLIRIDYLFLAGNHPHFATNARWASKHVFVVFILPSHNAGGSIISSYKIAIPVDNTHLSFEHV